MIWRSSATIFMVDPVKFLSMPKGNLWLFALGIFNVKLLRSYDGFQVPMCLEGKWGGCKIVGKSIDKFSKHKFKIHWEFRIQFQMRDFFLRECKSASFWCVCLQLCPNTALEVIPHNENLINPESRTWDWFDYFLTTLVECLILYVQWCYDFQSCTLNLGSSQ